MQGVLRMEKIFVCACGLTCSDCLFYKKEIYETADKLKQLIKAARIDTFLSIMSNQEVNASVADHLSEDKESFNSYFKMFKKLPEFLEVLDGLIEIQCRTTCREANGCSMCGTTKECAVIKCVKEKQLEGCWDCEENETCPKLIFQKMSYGKTISENLSIMKEKGYSAVPSRGNDYYEWQRNI